MKSKLSQVSREAPRQAKVADPLRAERWRRLSMLASERTSRRLQAPLPLVSIIVLNYNGAHLLPDCLSCLSRQTYPNIEIVLVDNASSDRSIEIAQRLRPAIESAAAIESFIIVRSSKNLGVAGGRNHGVAYASGEILAFIDNDAYADPEWVTQLTATFQREPEVDALASCVFFRRSPLILNGAGGLVSSDGTARDAFFEEELNAQRFPRSTPFPMGCGMAIRRSAAQEVFPLEAIFPKWYDDVELGFRIHALGSRVGVAPGAVIDHDFHSSDALITPNGWQIRLLYQKARLRHVIKYFPSTQLPVRLLCELRSIVNLLWSEQWREAPVLAAALLWNVLRIPSALPIRKRWALSASLCNSLVSAEFNKVDKATVVKPREQVFSERS